MNNKMLNRKNNIALCGLFETVLNGHKNLIEMPRVRQPLPLDINHISSYLFVSISCVFERSARFFVYTQFLLSCDEKQPIEARRRTRTHYELPEKPEISWKRPKTTTQASFETRDWWRNEKNKPERGRKRSWEKERKKETIKKQSSCSFTSCCCPKNSKS